MQNFEWADNLACEWAGFLEMRLRAGLSYENIPAQLTEWKLSHAPIPQVREVLLTTEDGVVIYKGETFHEVDLVRWYTMAESVLHAPPHDKYYKYFSTKGKAEEYILLNKPILSLAEIIDQFGYLSSNQRFIGGTQKSFMEFFKQKIDNNGMGNRSAAD